VAFTPGRLHFRCAEVCNEQLGTQGRHGRPEMVTSGAAHQSQQQNDLLHLRRDLAEQIVRDETLRVDF